jgi:hypothetical protein
LSTTYKDTRTEKAKESGDAQKQPRSLENLDELIPMGEETTHDQSERFKDF